MSVAHNIRNIIVIRQTNDSIAIANRNGAGKQVNNFLLPDNVREKSDDSSEVFDLITSI